MVTPASLDALVATIASVPGVEVVTLFGSHARNGADAFSDVDLQVVTRKPAIFYSSNWLHRSGYTPAAYSWRPAFGGVVKISAVSLAAGELDVVVVPYARLRLARILVGCGIHRRSRRLTAMLGNLSVVLRPGYRVLVGNRGWSTFFARVVRDVPDPKLTDNEIIRMSDCAYIDYHSVQRKVARGELVAAQRWLHLHLAEVNLKLWHEYRSRSSRPVCHDGRRAELFASADELAALTSGAPQDSHAILVTAKRLIQSIRKYRELLLGEPPTWRTDCNSPRLE